MTNLVVLEAEEMLISAEGIDELRLERVLLKISRVLEIASPLVRGQGVE